MMQTNLAGECVHCAKSKKQYRLASPLEAMAQREAMAQCEAMAQRWPSVKRWDKLTHYNNQKH